MNIVDKDISVYMSFGGLFGCVIGVMIAFGISSIAPEFLNVSAISQFYGACIGYGVFGGMGLGALTKLTFNILCNNQ